MNAIEALLGSSIDYAGLFPPARLDMHSAVRQYLEFRGSAYARILGRFVVDFDRFPYLWDAAGDYVQGMRLTVLATPESDWDELGRLVEKGFVIEAVEIKGARPAEIGRLAMRVPTGVTTYFEVPFDSVAGTLDAVATAGGRVKIRTGGQAPEAIPSPQALAQMLAELAARRLIFKATAGLHHVLRGRHPLNCADSETAVMHGFMNLATAAALLYFGGDEKEARLALEEEWPGAWRVSPDAILWEENGWNADELREVRQQFFAGFGSCSIQEPVQELEALRWL